MNEVLSTFWESKLRFVREQEAQRQAFLDYYAAEKALGNDSEDAIRRNFKRYHLPELEHEADQIRPKHIEACPLLTSEEAERSSSKERKQRQSRMEVFLQSGPDMLNFAHSVLTALQESSHRDIEELKKAAAGERKRFDDVKRRITDTVLFFTVR